MRKGPKLHTLESLSKKGNQFQYYWKGLLQRMNDHHVWLLSGGLTFSVFVCIFPFILIVFSILGSILQFSALKYHINSLLDKVIPSITYTTSLKTIIFSRIEEFVRVKNQAGFFGVFGLLFASSGLFGSMRTILNLIFKSKIKRPLLLDKLRDLALILLVLIFFLLSMVLLPTLEIVKEFIKKTDFIQLSGLTLFLSFITPLLIIFACFFFLYFSVPDRRIPRKIALISALCAAVLWEMAKQVFGYYVAHFTPWKEIYGTYTLFVFIAFWVYYSAFVFILGAEIGQLYREKHP